MIDSLPSRNVPQPKSLDAYIKEAAQQQLAFEQTRVRVGIIGRSGTGKSSLINAMVGEKLAQVGVVETTMEPEEFEYNGLVLVDLPGCGTPTFPAKDYAGTMRLDTYDALILVVTDRWFEDDAALLEQIIHELKVPYFIVRTKFDLAVLDGQLDHGLTEVEVRAKIEDNLRIYLGDDGLKKLYLVSSRYPARYDLPRLLEDVCDCLEGMKRERVEAALAAWTPEGLERKLRVGRHMVHWHALAAAANGMNPIPGLDVSVDLGILLAMIHKIQDLYHLHQPPSVDLASLKTKAIAGRAAALAAKYGTPIAVEGVMRQFAKREAGKTVAKWFPIVGQLVAGSLGYLLTYRLGIQVLEDYHNLAQQMVAELKDAGPHPRLT